MSSHVTSLRPSSDFSQDCGEQLGMAASVPLRGTAFSLGTCSTHTGAQLEWRGATAPGSRILDKAPASHPSDDDSERHLLHFPKSWWNLACTAHSTTQSNTFCLRFSFLLGPCYCQSPGPVVTPHMSYLLRNLCFTFCFETTQT